MRSTDERKPSFLKVITSRKRGEDFFLWEAIKGPTREELYMSSGKKNIQYNWKLSRRSGRKKKIDKRWERLSKRRKSLWYEYVDWVWLNLSVWLYEIWVISEFGGEKTIHTPRNMNCFWIRLELFKLILFWSFGCLCLVLFVKLYFLPMNRNLKLHF